MFVDVAHRVRFKVLGVMKLVLASNGSANCCRADGGDAELGSDVSEKFGMLDVRTSFANLGGQHFGVEKVVEHGDQVRETFVKAKDVAVGRNGESRA